MRQPDIEIYLKDASQDAITAWLSEALGSCSEWQQRGQTFQCRAGEIPVVFLPRAVGKWHSLMLESDAPYLLPRSLRPKPKSGHNEPAFLTEVLREVAAHRGESQEALAAHTTTTARAFFALPTLD